MSSAIVQKSTVYLESDDSKFAEAFKGEKQSSNDRISGSFNPLTSTSDMEHTNQKLDPYTLRDSDQYRIHGTLTRTVSQPQHDTNVASLVCTLIENLGNINLHRKLERTQSEPLPQQVNTSRYKTELCRPFEEAGECKYGEKCQFAHGYHELRNLQRHPKYKTEYCRTFHSVGFCPYGPRCHFVHNADEARALQEQHQVKQNHSYSNQCISTLSSKQRHNGLKHSLPLSPPLSMSTGSDRESPTGSLSLSPSSSMTGFPFNEQVSPVNTNIQTVFKYVNTPPESPNASMSPVNTPPSTIATKLYIKPTTRQDKQTLQKSASSPPIAIIRNISNQLTKANQSSLSADDARLPVFNRLSSAIENV